MLLLVVYCDDNNDDDDVDDSYCFFFIVAGCCCYCAHYLLRSSSAWLPRSTAAYGTKYRVRNKALFVNRVILLLLHQHSRPILTMVIVMMAYVSVHLNVWRLSSN